MVCLHVCVRAFLEYKASVAAGQPNVGILDELKLKVELLYDELMDLEMLLVETLNDVLDEFEDEFMQMITANLNSITTCFREVGDIVNWYVENITKLVHGLLDRMAKEEGLVDESPDVIALLSDRDVVLTAVTTSQDNHIAKVLAKEDEIREKEDNGGKKFVKDVRADEYARNRFRVAEIQEIVSQYMTTIDELMEENDDEVG